MKKFKSLEVEAFFCCDVVLSFKILRLGERRIEKSKRCKSVFVCSSSFFSLVFFGLVWFFFFFFFFFSDGC